MLRATRKPDRPRPQIRAPFRAGLLDCWLLTERGGGITLHNLARPGNPMTTVSDPPMVVTAGGRAVDFDGSADRAESLMAPELALVPMTAAVVFVADSVAFSRHVYGQWAGTHAWRFLIEGGGELNFYQRSGGFNARGFRLVDSLNADRVYSVIATSGGGDPPPVSVAVNGVGSSPAAFTNISATGGAAPVISLAAQAGGGSLFDGKILLAVLWDRQLPAELIRQWSANPWQMFAGPDTSIALATIVAGPAIHEHVSSGGLALGGAPTIQHVTGVWEHTPAGGLALGGAPAIAHIQIHGHVPAGGFALGGSPTISHITVGGAQVHVPTGGLAFGGAPAVTRLGTEGAYAFEWVHQREIRAVVYDAIVMEHTRSVRDPINGDGVLQLHARAIGDAPLRALFSADLQRPVATGEIFLPD